MKADAGRTEPPAAGYSIPRPRLPVSLALISLLLVAGLVALFMAAYYAFSLVAHSPAQAFFAAVMIEAGMVIEAVVLVRAWGQRSSWLALGGMAVSVVVSGTYNYIQARQVGALNGITGGWELLTLALGPLLALAFMAANAGRELRAYEQQVAGWLADRQAWHDRITEQARLDTVAIEQARLQAELERERLRLEAERLAEVERVKLDVAERRRQERRLDRLARQSADALPDAQTRVQGTYDAFAAAQAERNGTGPLQAHEIMAQFGVARRTAYNWLERYRRENPLAG